MDAKYSAFDLARYVLKKSIDDEHLISNLQLQKALYRIQVSFLKEKGRRAFPEPIEVSVGCPYVPKLYDHYCIYGGRTIPWIPDAQDVISINKKDKALIDGIIEEEEKLDPWESPWEDYKEKGAVTEVYNKGKGEGEEITIETIKKYLRKR